MEAEVVNRSDGLSDKSFLVNMTLNNCQQDLPSQTKTAEEPLGNLAALKCDIIASLCSSHLEEIQQGRIERR